jgi:hypothetical protein
MVFTGISGPDKVKTKTWVCILNTIVGIFIVILAVSGIREIEYGLRLGSVVGKNFDVIDIAVVAAFIPGLLQLRTGLAGIPEMNNRPAQHLFFSALFASVIGIVASQLGTVMRPLGFFGDSKYDIGILFVPFVIISIIAILSRKRIMNAWNQPRFRFALISLSLVTYWVSASIFSYWLYRSYLSVPSRIFAPLSYAIFFWPITIIPSLVTAYFTMKKDMPMFIAVFILLQIAAFAPLSSVPAFT